MDILNNKEAFTKATVEMVEEAYKEGGADEVANVVITGVQFAYLSGMEAGVKMMEKAYSKGKHQAYVVGAISVGIGAIVLLKKRHNRLKEVKRQEIEEVEE